MALPVERFFVLIEIVHERLEQEAKDELAKSAFLAWQIAQHTYGAMFTRVGFTVDKKNRNKFEQSQQKFWKQFPGFEKYLRDLGITPKE